MRRMRFVGVTGGALLAASLTFPAAPAAGDAAAAPGERTMSALDTRCASSRWCTPSYWAWQLMLASHSGDRRLAQQITLRLVRMQERDGRWGLGTAWGRAKIDFKRRTARDAESWEVAEVGLALLYAARASRIPAARRPARAAARYLARHIVRFRGGSYMAHMPDCNRWLQPHSTIAAAALLARFPRYRRQSAALRRSGVAMGWRRIIPGRGETRLRRARRGPAINDYERIQVGYYLSLMGRRKGAQILGTQARRRATDSLRAAPYLVVVYAMRGQRDAAERRADGLLGFRPQYGYDLALRDWITAMASDRFAHRSVELDAPAAPGQQPAAP